MDPEATSAFHHLCQHLIPVQCLQGKSWGSCSCCTSPGQVLRADVLFVLRCPLCFPREEKNSVKASCCCIILLHCSPWSRSRVQQRVSTHALLLASSYQWCRQQGVPQFSSPRDDVLVGSLWSRGCQTQSSSWYITSRVTFRVQLLVWETPWLCDALQA